MAKVEKKVMTVKDVREMLRAKPKATQLPAGTTVPVIEPVTSTETPVTDLQVDTRATAKTEAAVKEAADVRARRRAEQDK